MRGAVAAFWPSLEPELCLIHWLCVRNNLKPPSVSLQKINPNGPSTTEGKFTNRGLSPDSEATTLPALSARETPATPASTILTPQPPKTPLQRQWMRPVQGIPPRPATVAEGNISSEEKVDQ